jgi:hypothetical protein
MRPPSPLSEKSTRPAFVKRKAQEMRLRALYRKFAMRGGRSFSIDAVRGLVGPDCAYHLYGVIGVRQHEPSLRSLQK